MEKEKLIALGVKNARDLQGMLGCSMSLAYKIWYKQAGLSKMQAIKIKEKTGASLDFLLS